MPIVERQTTRDHKDKFRGRCALALNWNAKIAQELANAIWISPMRGCTDIGTIQTCRGHIAKMGEWLDLAEESARAVAESEAADE